MRVSNLSDLLTLTNEERPVDKADIPTRVLRMEVWHAIVSYPGCLGDDHAVARSKRDAIASAQYWLSDDEPRGMAAALDKRGVYYTKDGRVITLEKHPVGDLF
jgi:hypothetical protein